MAKHVTIDKTIMDIAQRYANVILQNYNVKAIILFGSYAKGTNHEDSDIDIAIITENLKNGDRIDDEIYLTKLRRNIDYRIEPHIIMLEDYENVSTPFIKEVIDTGIKVA